MKDLFNFEFRYGSTDAGRDALLNYVDVAAEVPPASMGNVCAELLVRSMNQEVYRGRNTCQSYSAWKRKWISWRLYYPSSPQSRPRVRKGLNEVRVGFTYMATGVFSLADRCAGSMPGSKDPITCGTATGSAVIR